MHGDVPGVAVHDAVAKYVPRHSLVTAAVPGSPHPFWHVPGNLVLQNRRRPVFERLVRETRAERHSKSFSSWPSVSACCFASWLKQHLRWNLFTHRELWAWLDNPFEVSPQPPPVQVAWTFGTAPLPGAET